MKNACVILLKKIKKNKHCGQNLKKSVKISKIQDISKNQRKS